MGKTNKVGVAGAKAVLKMANDGDGGGDGGASVEARPDEEAVLGAPLKVQLGGEIYSIKPLPYAKSRAWRKAWFDWVRRSTEFDANRKSGGDEWLAANMDGAGKLGDDRVDLFFGYARQLNRKQIESVASYAELKAGFNKILAIERPF